MKKIFLLIICLWCASASAQTMVLNVDRETDSIPSKRGPNLARYTYAFLYGGFVAGADEAGGRIKYGNSGEYGAGIRVKYKIGKVYSMGFEWGLKFLFYKIKQSSDKT